MFKNGKSKSTTPAAAHDVTVINRGTTVDGEVKVAGTIRVYGRMNGTLRSEGKVIVAEEGEVSGDLYAEAAEVSGTVEGVIEADRLDLRSTANVEGQVIVKTFTTETGAIFIGDCKMPQNGVLPSRAPAVPADASVDDASVEEPTEDADDVSSEGEAQVAEEAATEARDEDAEPESEAVPAAMGNGVKPLSNTSDEAPEPVEVTEDVEAETASDEQGRPRLW